MQGVSNQSVIAMKVEDNIVTLRCIMEVANSLQENGWKIEFRPFRV